MVQIWLSSEDQRKALTFPDVCDWKLLHSDSKQQDALFKSLHTYTCMLLISTHLTSYPGNCQLRSSEMWRARVPAAESRSLSCCPQPWTDSAAFEASRHLCCVGSSTTQQSRDTTASAISRRPGAPDQNQRLRWKRSHSEGCVTHSAFCRRYLTTWFPQETIQRNINEPINWSAYLQCFNILFTIAEFEIYEAIKVFWINVYLVEEFKTERESDILF